MEPARGSAATTVTGRFRQWLAGWGLTEWRRAALVTVLVATAAFGGLDTVNKKVVDIKPGEMFDTGRFEITVQRASLVKEIKAGERRLFHEKAGRRYLGLIATVKNTSTLPGNVYNPFELPGQPDARFNWSARFADGTVQAALGPGLTDEIVLVWDLPENAMSVGDDLSVRILKESRKHNATYGQGWVRSEDEYGRLTVPVGGPR
jgi:hypothetical protein